jgi:hypothetical protein
LVLLDSGESKFFVVENACRAAKVLVIVACDLYDATFWREIAF